MYAYIFLQVLQKKRNELCVLRVTQFVLKYFFQLQLMKAHMFVPFQSAIILRYQKNFFLKGILLCKSYLFNMKDKLN